MLATKGAAAPTLAAPPTADHAPRRFAAPLDRRELTWADSGKVDVDRRAGGLRALRRPHAGHERGRRAHAGRAADDRRRDQQVAPRPVYFFLIVHGDGSGWAARESVRFYRRGLALSRISRVNI